MPVHRGIKQRAFPAVDQIGVCRSLIGATRLVFNLCFQQRDRFWRSYKRQTGNHLTYRGQAAELTDLRREFPFLAESSQTAQQQALRDLDRAFQRFFAGTAGFPKPRKRGVDDFARIQGRECAFRKLNAKWSEVRIPKVGWLRFRSTRPIVGRVLNAMLSHTAVDGWTLSFSCEIELPDPAVNDNRPQIAIDLGVVWPCPTGRSATCPWNASTSSSVSVVARRGTRPAAGAVPSGTGTPS